MEISTIAVKQKRLKDWTRFVEREVSDPAIKSKTAGLLKQYSELLYQCFDKGQILDHDMRTLESLERELETLNEEARLSVVPQHVQSRSTVNVD